MRTIKREEISAAIFTIAQHLDEEVAGLNEKITRDDWLKILKQFGIKYQGISSTQLKMDCSICSNEGCVNLIFQGAGTENYPKWNCKNKCEKIHGRTIVDLIQSQTCTPRKEIIVAVENYVAAKQKRMNKAVKKPPVDGLYSIRS